MPKISIITPIYCDIEAKIHWLDETIQSVQSQTIADWEMILINDKSPLSLDVVKMQHATDDRLRWIENAENFGPAMTRNTAVALAESDCILPLDSDDLLAEADTLEKMYDAWSLDETKIIYGNLQVYTQSSPGVFRRGKVFSLGEYTFELAMNLGGVMPVTAMHSKECHYQAGGWKSALAPGLEDLEYWVAAGKRGFCGQKINHTMLIYRRQENSRAYKMKHINREYEAMQQKIKEMHSDIYQGRFPVACCGGKGKSNQPVSDPLVISQQNQSSKKARRITTLDGYDESELEWVAYQGPKQGSAGRILARGPSHLPSEYNILGKGHFFQIHKQHHKIFSDRQRLGFEINQPDPRDSEPVISDAPEPQVIAAPEPVPQPELSTIVRVDAIAAQTREINVQSTNDVAQRQYSLFDLGLGDIITERLDHDHWTVENLAKATAQQLILIPGIGIRRANNIISAAKELINGQ